jgi:hypothetical protein
MPARMGMGARVTIGILAIVGIALGVPFTILGIVMSGDGGTSFLVTGLAGLFLGGIFAGLFLAFRGQDQKQRAARTSTADAEVTDVQLHPGVRVGSMAYVTLTVRYPHATQGMQTVSRKLLIPPTMRPNPGTKLPVKYDPNDPANFAPAEVL